MKYDLAVVGAGWAGSTAARVARDSGLKVVLIEQNDIGGTCLNRGCIPTKALIQSAKIFSLTKKCSQFGVEAVSPKINFKEIQARKERIVSSLRQALLFSLKGVDLLQGSAHLVSPTALEVNGKPIEASNILIATGSQPFEPEFLKFDHKKVISSDTLLTITELPRSLLVIGGGVVGCEFASLFAGLGAQVSVVEKMPQLLPGMDPEIAKKLEVVFKKKSIKVSTNTDAASAGLSQFDLVLVCIGRSAFTSGLGLEQAGVKLEKSKIVVDDYLRTNIPNIYAAGDCTAKIMLAHLAAYQGEIAVRNILNPGAGIKADNPFVPACVFTDPEIASVGMTQEQALNSGLDIKVQKFDFLASGMARILDETEGFLKIISDKNNGVILGASIIGPRATELIATLALAASNKLTVAQLKKTIFAHPTLSEAIPEALHRPDAM